MILHMKLFNDSSHLLGVPHLIFNSQRKIENNNHPNVCNVFFCVFFPRGNKVPSHSPQKEKRWGARGRSRGWNSQQTKETLQRLWHMNLLGRNGFDRKFNLLMFFLVFQKKTPFCFHR